MAKVADLRKGVKFQDANGAQWEIITKKPSPMGTQLSETAAPNYLIMARRTDVKHPLRAQDMVVNQDMLAAGYITIL